MVVVIFIFGIYGFLFYPQKFHIQSNQQELSANDIVNLVILWICLETHGKPTCKHPSENILIQSIVSVETMVIYETVVIDQVVTGVYQKQIFKSLSSKEFLTFRWLNCFEKIVFAHQKQSSFCLSFSDHKNLLKCTCYFVLAFWKSKILYQLGNMSTSVMMNSSSLYSNIRLTWKNIYVLDKKKKSHCLVAFFFSLSNGLFIKSSIKKKSTKLKSPLLSQTKVAYCTFHIRKKIETVCTHCRIDTGWGHHCCVSDDEILCM